MRGREKERGGRGTLRLPSRLSPFSLGKSVGNEEIFFDETRGL
jgi:hypothetical protein